MADPQIRLTQGWDTPLKRSHIQPLRRPYPLLNGCVLALLPVRGDKWCDFSLQENHGTFTGGGFISQGRFGPAVYFDGSGDYVSLTNAITLDTGDSFCLWEKETDITVREFILGVRGTTTNFLKLTDADSITLRQNDNTYVCWDSFTPSLIDGWNFIGITIHDNLYELYVNGVSMGTDTYSDVFKIQHIGDAYSGTFLFDGMIDELTVYDRLLSKGEIKYLYELGRPY